MRFRNFSQIAKYSFTPLLPGNEYFYPFGGLEAKPYIVPDPETGRTLYSKQLWFLRLCFGIIIFGQPILFLILPETIHNLLRFIISFIVSIFLCWFVHWLLFKKILAKENHLPINISNKNVYIDSLEKQSAVSIFLGFLISLILLLCGIVLLINAIYVGWIGVLFFEVCTIIWGYILLLKVILLHRKNPANIKKSLLVAMDEQDAIKFESAIISVFEAKIPEELSEILGTALPMPWHYRHEDIVQALQKIKDPLSVDVLFETAFAKFDYLRDEYFELARKCTWALADIGTPEAKQRLEELATCSNKLIAGYAGKRLRNWDKELPRKGKHVD